MAQRTALVFDRVHCMPSTAVAGSTAAGVIGEGADAEASSREVVACKTSAASPSSAAQTAAALVESRAGGGSGEGVSVGEAVRDDEVTGQKEWLGGMARAASGGDRGGGDVREDSEGVGGVWERERSEVR